MAGGYPLIVRGFTIPTLVIGTLAQNLTIITADSVAYNLNASESGSFLWVPPDRANEVLNPTTNSRISGSWISGATNYVGIDFVRSADSATSDLAQFLNLITKTDDPRRIPLGRTLDYKIIITTVPFSAQTNIVPIAQVVLDSSGVVTTIVDARSLMFRLGAGGDSPSTTSYFGWGQGRTDSSTTFTGGDKGIYSQKDWMDAVCSRIWEIGGGDRWFTPAADRNVKMFYTGSVFVNGEYFSWDGTTLGWQGLIFKFDNSVGTTNEVAAGSIAMADGEVLYVDLDRTTNHTVSGLNPLTAAKVQIANLGVGNTPGSRWIVAWRIGSSIYTRDWRYPVGTTFQPATVSSMGTVRLSSVSTNTSSPIVIADTGGTITGLLTINNTGTSLLASTSTNVATIYGQNTNGAGIGVWGDAQAGSSAVGVLGSALTGLGISGTATTGTAVKGVATTGFAGLFSSSGTSNATVSISNSSTTSGSALAITGVTTNSGTGYLQTIVNTGAGGCGLKITGVGGFPLNVIQTGFGSAITASSGFNPLNITGPLSTFDATVAGGNVLTISGNSSTSSLMVGNSGGAAYESTAGGMIIPPASTYGFTTVKTGKIYIGTEAFQNGQNASLFVLGTGQQCWGQATAATYTVYAPVNLPRGAKVVGCDLRIANTTGVSYSNIPNTNAGLYYITDANTATPAVTTIADFNNAPGTVLAGTSDWIPAVTITPITLPMGGVTAGDSASIYFKLTFDNLAGVYFSGARITYTYSVSDFMI
jgi:hypothetical protein